jgi:membrane protease YdiL (CAAX protease family)
MVMRRRHEALSSAGITKHNFGKSALLGIILSAFMFLFHMITKRFYMGGVLRSISLGDFWALATFLVVGSSEEFGFRGYLQTRLMSWLGTVWGWVLASTLMAVMHVVQRITVMGMAGTDAIVSSLSLIPISLLYGYIMLQTENVVAGTILHAFIDWSSVVYFT